MLPADQTVDVVPIDEEEHEYSVKLRNAAPVVAPQTELKMEAARKAEVLEKEETNGEGKENEKTSVKSNEEGKENAKTELKSEIVV